MNRSTLFVIATGLFAGVLSIVACSSDTGTGAGPTNQPPTVTPQADGGGPSNNDGSANPDGSSSGTVCTGPTFDNTRIPGWPTVPQP
jgi:hypothetical protein